MDKLIQQAQREEISRDEFEERVTEITVGLLLFVFLMGSRLSLSDVMSNFEAQITLTNNERIARESAQRLATDIYDKRQFEPGPELTRLEAQLRRRSRVQLWVGTALGIYALGQMFRKDDPFLEWGVGPTEHCSDCARLNGQIHTASEWRASGWQPQGRSLECNGYRCQCSFAESTGPSRGSF